VSTVAPGPDLAGLVALVDRLQVENRRLAEAAAVWQTRAAMLEERLALAPHHSPWMRQECPNPRTRPQSATHPLVGPLAPAGTRAGGGGHHDAGVAGVATVSGEDWPTVGWSTMAVGAVLLVVWIWLRDQRR
jgi:hypothetical protein